MSTCITASLAPPYSGPFSAPIAAVTAHGITVVTTDPQRAADARRFDPDSGLLLLSPWLSEAQRAFQLATQLALLEHGSLLDTLVAGGELASDQAAGLARIGLANYFAGALLMPYTAFHRAAEELRYDIELLQARFGVGFETVCHRLATLQRTGDRGVPFSFLRVDRAGNISKRQSASDSHFSRLGGTSAHEHIVGRPSKSTPPRPGPPSGPARSPAPLLA